MSHVAKRTAGEAFEDHHTSKHRSRKRRSKHNSAKQLDTDPSRKGEGALQAYAQIRPDQTISSNQVIKDATETAVDHPRHASKPNTPLKGIPPKIESHSPTAKKQKPSKEKVAKRERLALQAAPESADRQALVIPDRGDTKKQVAKEKHRSYKPTVVDNKRWNISKASGGVFINHDPILTTDNKHIILPTKSNIQIYSTNTSLLVRSIQIKDSAHIRSCVVSASDSDVLFVVAHDDSIYKFNLSTGRKLGQWHTHQGLSHLVSLPINDGSEVLLAVRSSETHNDLHHLVLIPESSKVKSTVLLGKLAVQKAIKTSSDGSVIVLFGDRKITIGYNINSAADQTKSREYKWHDLVTSGRIVCCDARITQAKDKKSNKYPTVDVVVGHQTGALVVYDNLLAQLVGKEIARSSTSGQGRRLHWHRSAVRAVKWSRDGSYLVSGGDESVLVIWQLDTNQKQFLPHLSTAILNIEISQAGAHYAIRLADNSVMVLSTADLMPSTNITGLSLGQNASSHTTALIHPVDSNRLLAVVPAQSVGQRLSSSIHLQTFDIDTNLHLGKQALTRNLTTAVSVGPTGEAIKEPEVEHIGISEDGKWLATIDVWSPNPQDSQALYLEQDSSAVKDSLTETVLRFWAWNDANKAWDLTTRVDEPHPSSKHTVIAMACKPSALEFVTMGRDGSLKFWTPKARVRDGVGVTDRAGEALYTWSCSRQFQIEKDLVNSSTSEDVSGVLAYSEDGSVIAASWSSLASERHRHVHLIDTMTGTIVSSPPKLLTHGPATLAFSGRHLLALSEHLVIFDTISLQISFTLAIDAKYTSTGERSTVRSNFLAVSFRSNHFAIGVNAPKSQSSKPGQQSQLQTSSSNQVLVFDIESASQGPIAEFSIADQIRCLVADPSGHGYVLIDGDAKIRKITPPGFNHALATTSSMALISQPELGMQLTESSPSTMLSRKGIEGIFGSQAATERGSVTDEQRLLLENTATATVDTTVTGDERITTRPNSLEDLFSSMGRTTTALPSVSELFEKVAKAVAGVGA